MKQLLITGVQSFGFSLVLTPIIRDVFRSFRVVDQPDHGRKVHVQPIPRVGGIAITAAYVLTFYLSTRDGISGSRELSIVSNVLPAALLIFLTGLLDDFFGLKPWQKLIGQIIASALAWWAGVRIFGIGGHDIPEIWSFPLTVGWLLVCTNAFNLVDGLDGLAAGIGLFATLTMFAAALIHGNTPLAFATLPLAGCLLGFLCFNFNPATVFLGDCGSLLIGFLLGCFGAIWAQKSVTLLGLTAPLIALSLPLLDVLLCIVRRWLRNQPIFGADRGHIHHKLLDRGLTPRQAVLLLYGLCGLATVFSLLQSYLNDVYVAGFLVVGLAAAAWMGVHYLRYAEFVLAGEILRTGEFQRSINARMHLSAFATQLANANTIEECWSAILERMPTFGFSAVRLRTTNRLFEEWGASVSSPRYWTMRIPLSETESIEFARELNSPVLPMVVVSFVELIATELSARLKDAATDGARNRGGSIAMQTGD